MLFSNTIFAHELLNGFMQPGNISPEHLQPEPPSDNTSALGLSRRKLFAGAAGLVFAGETIGGGILLNQNAIDQGTINQLNRTNTSLAKQVHTLQEKVKAYEDDTPDRNAFAAKTVGHAETYYTTGINEIRLGNILLNLIGAYYSPIDISIIDRSFATGFAWRDNPFIGYVTMIQETTDAQGKIDPYQIFTIFNLTLSTEEVLDSLGKPQKDQAITFRRTHGYVNQMGEIFSSHLSAQQKDQLLATQVQTAVALEAIDGYIENPHNLFMQKLLHEFSIPRQSFSTYNLNDQAFLTLGALLGKSAGMK